MEQVRAISAGTAEWEKARRLYLTGSNAAAMLGLSPYETKEEFLERAASGVAKEFDVRARRRMWWGDYLEEYNLAALGKWIGRKVEPRRHLIVHADHPLAATLDGVILPQEQPASPLVGTKPPTVPPGLWPVELKNTEKYRYDPDEGLVDNTPLWAAGGPVWYYVQLQTQLLCTGKEYGVLCAKIGAADMRAHVYPADKLLHEELIEASYEYQKIVGF